MSTLPRTLLARVGAVLLPLLAACSAEEDPRPNVVLITLDTTRADYFGIHGHPAAPTPNFDELGARGVIFEDALATAAVTPVSHASILTGRYPYSHGVRVLSAESGYRMEPDVPSLAPWLRDRGWRTGAVHSAFPVSSHFGFDQGFDHFDSVEGNMNEDDAGSHRWEVDRFQRRSDEATDRALDFVDGGETPFFLWLHYWDPHDDALLPPDEFLEGVPTGGRSFAQYAAEVRYVDDQFGRLMRGLRERGLDENTIVAVTADHGEGLGEHGWFFHRLLYQEQIHVPMLLHVPGGPAGKRVGGFVSTVDLVPTLLDYLELPDLPGTDGRSLRAAMEGAPLETRSLYADQINGYDLNSRLSLRRPNDDFLYCLVRDPWKLVYRPAHPAATELYDLRADPDESVNRFASEPEVRVELLRELAQRQPWVLAPFTGGVLAADAQAALASLGYTAADSTKPSLGTRWEFVCVDHPDVVTDAPDPCTVCGEPPLLRAKPPGAVVPSGE